MFSESLWPISAVIIVIILKYDINRLINLSIKRGFSFKFPWIEAKLEAEQRNALDNPANYTALNKMLPEIANDALRSIEERVASDAKLIDQAQRENTLIRAVAVHQLRAGHEFIYNRMYGSQIQLLKQLNELGGTASIDLFNYLYDDKSKYYSNYSFLDWIGFLVSANMIVISGSNAVLTVFGRDFLLYIVNQGLAEQKPL